MYLSLKSVSIDVILDQAIDKANEVAKHVKWLMKPPHHIYNRIDDNIYDQWENRDNRYRFYINQNWIGNTTQGQPYCQIKHVVYVE